MSVILGCLVLSVSVVLIWSSLRDSEGNRPPCGPRARIQDHLEYIRISPALLGEWVLRDDDLIMIDMRPRTQAGAEFDNLPGSLRILPEHLKNYLWYLPPNTRLVLYDEAPVARLDSSAESVLLMGGFQAVYILEGSIRAWHAWAVDKRGAMVLFPR